MLALKRCITLGSKESFCDAEVVMRNCFAYT